MGQLGNSLYEYAGYIILTALLIASMMFLCWVIFWAWKIAKCCYYIVAAWIFTFIAWIITFMDGEE